MIFYALQTFFVAVLFCLTSSTTGSSDGTLYHLDTRNLSERSIYKTVNKTLISNCVLLCASDPNNCAQSAFERDPLSSMHGKCHLLNGSINTEEKSKDTKMKKDFIFFVSVWNAWFLQNYFFTRDDAGAEFLSISIFKSSDSLKRNECICEYSSTSQH